jgi:hypothetical protein
MRPAALHPRSVDRLDNAPRRDRRDEQLGAQACSASLTALVMAAGGGMAPPSPMPFWPKRV